MIILTSIIIAVGVIGYFAYQIYGSPQNIQNEATKIMANTENKIQQISPQLMNMSSSQNKPFSLTSQDGQTPIAVYDDCHSTLRSDQSLIETSCNGKQFTFAMPDVLEQALQNQVPLWVKTKVYQYGVTDFKIGLFDQVSEKNYTVSLWQFPK